MSNIKNYLQDIVAHTHSLGFLPLVKISSNDDTQIESISEDRSVIMFAKTHEKVDEFIGVFGMPNLDKLNLHLKNPEYKENAKIKVVTTVKDEKTIPTSLHFENASGDFRNEYRFMGEGLINEKLKMNFTFRTPKWDIEFEPSLASISRLKLQAQAHSEEEYFKAKTEDGNLVFSFGDVSTHAGSFNFEQGINGKLKHTWAWPITQLMSILNLSGTKVMKLSDAGAMLVTVDSGLAVYEYILPASQ